MTEESASSFIDLVKNIIQYNNQQIFVIDDGNEIWFSAISIAKALEYSNTNQAILSNVNKEDKKSFSTLFQYVKTKLPDNIQSSSIFINESGLYSLILSSRMNEAKKFKKWITKTVIPSIRKYGIYQVKHEDMKQIKKINEQLDITKDQLKIAQNRIETLEHNQTKTKYDNGGRVYAFKSPDINQPYIRIGKTNNIKKRKAVYDTSTPNKFIEVYSITVPCPVSVELCIRSALYKYRYMNNKDYYNVSVDKIKEIFNRCANLVSVEYGDQCNTSSDINQNDDAYGGASGGPDVTPSSNYYHYLKYKFKYFRLLHLRNKVI